MPATEKAQPAVAPQSSSIRKRNLGASTVPTYEHRFDKWHDNCATANMFSSFLKHIIVAAGLCALADQLRAEVLVYRCRLTSALREGDFGAKSEGAMPSSLSFLEFIDLDTDCWFAGDESQSIYLNESKTNKSYYASPSENSKSFTKFGFYANGKKFFLFGSDWGYPESLSSGLIKFNTDFGCFQTFGACSTNVDIGTRKSSVPKDMVVTMLRGDAELFKKFVFSVKYDSILTKASNQYLRSAGINSDESGTSKAIPAAQRWLVSEYLPSRYPNPYPFSED